MRGVAAATAGPALLPTCAIFSISSIGVIPATGSLANCHEYASAPITLPSMNTGEPLMPAMTPARCTCGELILARIRFCPGPMLCSTPRISTSNFSSLVPSKTVRP